MEPAASSPKEREVNSMARRRLLDQDGAPLPSTPCGDDSDLRPGLLVLGKRVEHLEKYEDKQNGTLQRFEAKLDKMCDEVNDKIDRLTWKIVGGMGSICLILIAYIIEESIRH
jgi:hypothetical protein